MGERVFVELSFDKTDQSMDTYYPVPPSFRVNMDRNDPEWRALKAVAGFIGFYLSVSTGTN